jgi:glycosyltransferase involved in cell wall biosynthesis
VTNLRTPSAQCQPSASSGRGASSAASALRLSACLIAKNERENVEPCLRSFAQHVDEIVFCDTGSRDGTVAEVRRVCRAHGWTDRLVLGRFKWCDDFAAARNHAASLATGDVHVWVDLDDRVMGAENLRSAAKLLSNGVDHVYARYAHSGRDGAVSLDASTYEEMRPRLLRAPVRWRNPTWETPELRGESCSTDLVWWWHRKTKPRRTRDLVLARAWVQRDPRDFLAWWAYASEARDCESYGESLSACRRLLRRSTLTDGERAEVHALTADVLRRLAVIEDSSGKWRQAERHADRSFALSPNPRGALVAAKCAFVRGDYRKSSERARWLLEHDCWISRDLLISAGLQLCYAEACRGRWLQALQAATVTLPLLPAADPQRWQLRTHMGQWRAFQRDSSRANRR